MQESIHQAATMVLLRESKSRVEVYMTKRPETMRFLPGHLVFPGGQMDEADADPRLLERCLPVPQARNPEGLPLTYFVTAVRETFEEAGLLLARDVSGELVLDRGFEEEREALLDGTLSFADLVAQANVQLATDCLRYFGHRLTPRKVSKKRFDTRYFLTIIPAGVEPKPHEGEVAAAAWAEARQVLEFHAEGRVQMAPPTVDSLRVLARFASADEAWQSVEGVGKPTAFELE